MNPIEWLSNREPGFAALTPGERDAIMQFSLLWSYFEAKAFNTEASVPSILKFSKQLTSNARFDIEPFTQSLGYFKKRYFNNGEITEPFAGLRLRDRDRPELVERVIKGENATPAEQVSVLLIIGYTVPVIWAIIRYRSIYLPFIITPLLCNLNKEKILALIQSKK